MLKVLNSVGLKEQFDTRDLSGLEMQYVNDADLTKELIEEADVIIGRYNAEQLSWAKKCRLYQHGNAGSDNLKAEWFREGMVACNATGTFGTGISEYMIGSIILMMRNFSIYQNQQKDHLWLRHPSKNTIAGSKILVVGFGDIGSEFAHKVHYMGATVTAIRRHPEDKPDYVEKMGSLADLDTMIQDADVVALALPKSDATTNVISEKQLKLMKKTAYLVNVGRGTAVNIDDLAVALKNHEIAGATLDVFPTEPLDPSHSLWDLDNMVITPHASGNLDLEVTKNHFVDLAMHNIRAVETDQNYRNVVDFKTGYRTYKKCVK